MRYDAVIKSLSSEDFPEKIVIDDNNTAVIKEAKLIITEFDRNVDPICGHPLDKGFSVGLKVLAEVRHFKDEGDGLHSVFVEKEQFGDYVVLGHDASLKDVMEIIPELIRTVQKGIVGEPTEA